MADLGKNIVQRAFYLGLGLASYASEKATGKLNELRAQAQKLADEMVERGEMTTDEARRFVDDLVKQAQTESVAQPKDTDTREPRRIEILSEDEEPTQEDSDNIDALRQQVQSLQDELRRLNRE